MHREEEKNTFTVPYEKQQQPLLHPQIPNLITNMSHNFYKTRICPHIALGQPCFKGTSCNFAHSYDELSYRPNLSKTKLCIYFSKKGFCPNGNNCSFAHGARELYATPDYYKTVMCREFPNGSCKFGNMCRFAHCTEELRPKPNSSSTTIRPHKTNELPNKMYFSKSKTIMVNQLTEGLPEIQEEEINSYYPPQNNEKKMPQKQGSFFNIPEIEPLEKLVSKGHQPSWKQVYRPIELSNISTSTKESSNQMLLYSIGSTLSIGTNLEKD